MRHDLGAGGGQADQPGHHRAVAERRRQLAALEDAAIGLFEDAAVGLVEDDLDPGFRVGVPADGQTLEDAAIRLVGREGEVVDGVLPLDGIQGVPLRGNARGVLEEVVAVDQGSLQQRVVRVDAGVDHRHDAGALGLDVAQRVGLVEPHQGGRGLVEVSLPGDGVEVRHGGAAVDAGQAEVTDAAERHGLEHGVVVALGERGERRRLGADDQPVGDQVLQGLGRGDPARSLGEKELRQRSVRVFDELEAVALQHRGDLAAVRHAHEEAVGWIGAARPSRDRQGDEGHDGEGHDALAVHVGILQKG